MFHLGKKEQGLRHSQAEKLESKNLCSILMCLFQYGV